MRITYQLSKKDFSEAVGQHGGAWMKISVVLGLALLLLGMAYLALNPRQFPTPIGVIAGGLALAFSGRLRTHAAFGDKRLQNKIEAVLSDEGVEIATPTATSKLSWDAFTRYAETKNLFMIYQSANTFNILPKRAFAARAPLFKQELR
jgi:hypothetical protein